MAQKLAKLKTQKRDIKLNNLAKFYIGLMQNKASIGVHKEQGSHNVDKAFWNEFGATPFVLAKPMRKRLIDGTYAILDKGTVLSIPARPFVRLYLYPQRLQKVLDEYKNSYNSILHGKLRNPLSDAKKLLNNVGLSAKNEMHDIILSKTLLPNAELTIAIKGFNYPLFKTGAMVNAIRNKVKKING